jgi:hypothetical protein
VSPWAPAEAEPSIPPKSITSPCAPSYAIACPEDAGGLVAGIRFVQIVPSHAHVSERYPEPSYPPKITTWPPSYAIACPSRTGGLVAGIRCTQLMPSHSHVSERYAPPVNPPKRTVVARALS